MVFLDWLSGGISNAIASSILNPMDVAKTRMQAEEIYKSASLHTDGTRKRSLRETFQELFKEGGIIGLWRPGLKASICREFLYSGPRAGFYVPVRNFFDSDGESLTCKVLAAMTTGTLGAIIANPIDVIKIRMMVNASLYPSIHKSFMYIYREEGIAGLYKGLAPSTLRGAFIAVGELATYDQTKTVMKYYFHFQEGLPLHTVCSLVTGLVATTVAAPFDLLKTRSMNSSSTVSVGSLTESLLKVVKEEGALTLFRGWVPAYLRLGPHALICFPILEQIRRLFGLSYI